MAAFDNVINLNGKRYRVRDVPVEQTITQFPEKIIEGREPETEDHTLVSTLGEGDFSGGWGRFKYQKGGDNDRFWRSTLDTRWPGYLVTLPSPSTVTVGNAASYVSPTEGGMSLWIDVTAGEVRPMWYAGTTYQLAGANATSSGFGTMWNTGVVNTGTLTGGGITYITDSIPFQGGQLFACADTNRAPIAYRYSATNILSGVTTSTSVPLAMKFAVLGENVYMAGHKSGDAKTIYISTSTAPYSSSTWTDVLSFQRDDKETTIWFFVQGYDGRGLPCFYLGTSRSIFQIDIVRGIAQKIFSFPKPYPFSAMVTAPVSACVWDKTGNLYVAAGQNLWEFDGGGYQNISPFASGDGMPNGIMGNDTINYQANILDIFPRREEICASLDVASPTPANALLLSWRNGTWHTLMEAGSTRFVGRGIAHQNAIIVRYDPTGGPYTTLGMIWDADISLPVFVRKTSDLSSAFVAGHLFTPWHNAGFPNDQKIVLAVVVNGGPASVLVSYQKDQSVSSTSLTSADITTWGQSNEMPVASGVGDSGRIFRYDIRLDKSAAGGAPTFGMIESIGIKYLLVPKTLWGWRAEIDLTDDFEGRSPDTMLSELKALMDGTTLYAYYYGQEVSPSSPRYVRVSAESLTNSLDPMTLDPTTTMHITLLEPRPSGGFV